MKFLNIGLSFFKDHTSFFENFYFSIYGTQTSPKMWAGFSHKLCFSEACSTIYNRFLVDSSPLMDRNSTNKTFSVTIFAILLLLRNRKKTICQIWMQGMKTSVGGNSLAINEVTLLLLQKENKWILNKWASLKRVLEVSVLS